MKFAVVITSIFMLLVHNLNGQTRTIHGRVISEYLEELPGVCIQDIDTLLIGETDIDGRFQITIPKETDTLIISWLAMEWATINLQFDCDTIEIILLHDATYDFISSRKIDRLRKKRFNKVPEIHSSAVDKGIFYNNEICYSKEFTPYKPELDEIARRMKIKRKEIRILFKELGVGDTVRVPYSGTWRHDGTDRTALHTYSYVVDGKKFDCIIKGVITEKNKLSSGYNLTYKVIDCDECKYQNIILNGQELTHGISIEHNMKYFKILKK